VPELTQATRPAIVSRCDTYRNAQDRYLQLTAEGTPRWIEDPEAATAFESMREAQRAAVRLPAALRAYGVPRHAELMVARDLH
jgi:hypothetical protein